MCNFNIYFFHSHILLLFAQHRLPILFYTGCTYTVDIKQQQVELKTTRDNVCLLKLSQLCPPTPRLFHAILFSIFSSPQQSASILHLLNMLSKVGVLSGFSKILPPSHHFGYINSRMCLLLCNIWDFSTGLLKNP
uniref:Uncharacterized protein n=1 Tax=Micrurus surinamensis TaxID=129470 RepID=A0A2D4PPX2_MICSU